MNFKEIEVTFLDYYGKEISTKKIAEGKVLKANDIPVAPTLENLDFLGWSYGIDKPITIKNNVFVARYYAETAEDLLVLDKLKGLNDYGLDLFKKVDCLPKVFTHIASEQQSSYSRDGGNADGFGITNHAGANISGEKAGEDDPNNRILLNLNQPGIIYRMWYTTWDLDSPRIKIYIDGEETPSYDLSFNELASGKHHPFTGSLVYDQKSSSGGIVSYVPIVFKRSIKVIGSGYFYYNINYQKYPEATKLEYVDYSKLTEVDALMNYVGNDPKDTYNDKAVKNSFSLKANEIKTIYESFNKQTVTALKLNFNDFTVRKFHRNEHEQTGINVLENENVTYNVKIQPNKEIKLIFKGVLMNVPQKAFLEIDDIFVTDLVFRARRFDGFEWRDSEYFYDQTITLEPTKKTNLKITVGSGVEVYNMRVIVDGEVIDQIDFGSSLSKTDHNFAGSFTSVTKSLEYDPNHLIATETWEEIYKEEDIINQVYFKITYRDMGVGVYAPVSSFFGFGAFGMFETLGFLVGLKKDGTMYCYYPMPHEAGIKIELINKSNYNFSQIESRISFENNLFNFGEYGYFKMHYFENIHDTPTALVKGKPIDFLDIAGQGLIAGVTHSMSAAYIGEHSRFYLEGDEQIYIDGSMSHSFHGTGTEDFYNGGWYFKTGVQTTPLFGQSNHNYRNKRDRTVMLRTFITDPIYFRSAINFKMEHGGWNESEKANVYGAVYYYHLEKESIKETDSFDLAKSTDIKRVNYSVLANSNLKQVPKGTKYEGYYYGLKTKYKAYYELKKGSSFTVNISKDNQGVILRREYLMRHIGQQANVYVDGNFVGLWHSSFRNAYESFARQDDFYIPLKYTKDKPTITIKIEVVKNSESEVWTESMYQIFSVFN